jgi:hypothetical protein
MDRSIAQASSKAREPSPLISNETMLFRHLISHGCAVPPWLGVSWVSERVDAEFVPPAKHSELSGRLSSHMSRLLRWLP